MIAVISHDAGGAEILSSYVKTKDLKCLYVLDGPAKLIFERKLGPINISSLEDAIEKSSLILCGTSWQSDIEFNAIKYCRNVCKPTVAFLDHWINYKERFIRDGEIALPNEIWVGDEIAKTMAKECFPNIPVYLVENPYLKENLELISNYKKSNSTQSHKRSILYICEPISEHALLRHGDTHYWGYTEFEALKFFLKNINSLKIEIDHILIRPHPSEKTGKYDWVLKDFNLPIKINNNTSLIEEIHNSYLVVGCESMAMVIALLAEKKVISCIPTEGRSCVLPHRGIFTLQDIIKSNLNITNP